MKKVVSIILVTIIALSVMVIPAFASFTMEDAMDGDKVYSGTPAKITADGTIDPIWEKAKEFELTGRLPDSANRNRAGLSAGFKHLWDKDNFYFLVKITGDKDITVDGKKLIGSFYCDKTNILLTTPAALEDELYPEFYSPNYAGRTNDVSVKIHRRDPQNAPDSGSWEKSTWIMPAVWSTNGKPNYPDLVKSTESAIPKMTESLSIYETNDAEQTYYIQVAIPWIDAEYAKDGKIVGIDVSYEDTMSKALVEYLKKPMATANCYYAEAYGESVNVPLFAVPRTLSQIPVDLDPAAAAVISSISALNPATITLGDKQGIADIRAAYNGLAEDQKAKVSNIADLKALEDRIAALEAAQGEGEKVFEQISKLPSTIKLSDEAAVAAARAAYDALNDDQKFFVTNLNVLEAAETEISSIKNANNGGGNQGGGITDPETPNNGTETDGNPSSGDTSGTSIWLAGILILSAGFVLALSKKRAAISK
ncbi:MAG: sugar-binding protein [Oscillospiraceae bacterium]